MSACSPHIFRSCARRHHVRHTLDIHASIRDVRAARLIRRNATTLVEPLAPFTGAAAFLIARGFFPFAATRVLVKEPIEKQANRHH
jgi:hypothetical protein